MAEQGGRAGRLIAVDPSADFAEDLSAALDGARVVAARNVSEAAGIAATMPVDAVVLGPSHGNEAGVGTAAALAGIVPGIPVVLAANVVTGRIGAAAEAAGLAGVVSTPVTAAKLDAVLAARAAAAPGTAGAADAHPAAGEAVEPLEEKEVTVVLEAFRHPEPAVVAVGEGEPGETEAGEPAAGEQAAAEPVPGEPAEERMLVFEVFPEPSEPEGREGAPTAASDEAAAATGDVVPAGPRLEGPAVPRPREGRVVAVMSGKGGSGKTITAVNLAAALTMEGAGGVAVVDADFQFGDVALMLALDPAGTLAEAAAAADAGEIGRVMSLHERGIAVLAAPARPMAPGEIDGAAIVRVVESLAAGPGIVIVDTPPVFDDVLLEVLEAADLVLLVVDMDLPSVRSAITALAVLRASGFPLDRVRAVVNRADSKARLDQEEMVRSLGVRLIGTIPSDRLVPQSVNEGEPLVFLAERSRVARSFRRMAADLLRLLAG